jgi:hypothetical protein
VIVGHLGAAYARAKRRGDAEKTLKELQTLSEKQYVPASSVAMVYAALGDRAKALDWLEKAHGEHDFSIAQIGVAPWFKDLRNEPRFQALLKRIGLQ